MLSWCSFIISKMFLFYSDTPADVKKIVTAAVNFLDTYILGEEYKPWNMFFSGSFKGFGVRFIDLEHNQLFHPIRSR